MEAQEINRIPVKYVEKEIQVNPAPACEKPVKQEVKPTEDEITRYRKRTESPPRVNRRESEHVIPYPSWKWRQGLNPPRVFKCVYYFRRNH